MSAAQPGGRRHFLRQLGGASFGVMALSTVWGRAAARRARIAPQAAGDAEAFWSEVARSYRPSAQFRNLESGFYSPTPEPVLDAVCGHMRRINEIPSFYMRRHQDEEKEAVVRQLAAFAGVTPEEIVVTRNTTESLNTVIHGLELEPGQAILYCDREYPAMQAALEQRSERYGTPLQKITLPYLPGDEEAIVAAYRDAITPATRVILVSHMIYITGQILPVRAICDLAHERGIEVICDAAHSFAHLAYRIPELGCDYLGCSLHKWLGAPLGNGLLYVKRDRIHRVWPLIAERAYPEDDIRKLGHRGTHPVADQLAIADALRFHEAIGSERKERRLRLLRDRWVERVKDHPRIHLQTPLELARSCALATVAIDGWRNKALADALYDEFRIFTVAVREGVRIAPNLHLMPRDVDPLADALLTLAGRPQGS
jgi:selenocysteine lyase/cysteine desulfurase